MRVWMVGWYIPLTQGEKRAVGAVFGAAIAIVVCDDSWMFNQWHFGGLTSGWCLFKLCHMARMSVKISCFLHKVDLRYNNQWVTRSVKISHSNEIKDLRFVIFLHGRFPL